MNLSIHSFVHRKLVILKQDTSAQVAARAMRDQEVGCVLVIDPEGQLTGIVTDRDFACRWAADYSQSDVTLSQIMTPELLKAEENDGLNFVISQMETHGVRRIPIVSKDSRGRERVVGIVTLDDLIASGAVAPRHLSQIVRRQIRHRLAIPLANAGTSRFQRRSDDHTIHTLNRFYAFLAQATGLSSESIPQITHFILGSLLMRVTATAASHFAAQLPKLLQSSLLDLPPGPDRNITMDWIFSELVSRYQFTESFSRLVFVQFLAGLQNLVNGGLIRHLKSQLPDEFQAFFPQEKDRFDVSNALLTKRVESVMYLESSAFQEGQEIPIRYTGEGANVSPPLSWSQVPPGTREFVLICEDPNPTFETSWVHWVVFGISPTVTSLPEGIQGSPELEGPVRVRQGKNSWGSIGYQGPMPPVAHPPHQYLFRLYAIDREVILSGGVTRTQLASEIRNHIIAEAVLSGVYQHTALQKTA